jgi:hypothetical protein
VKLHLKLTRTERAGSFLFLPTFKRKLLGFLLGILFVATGAGAANGTFIDSTMVWDGVTRYYEVYLPPVLPKNPPMLLMLHGTSFEVPPDSPITKNWGWLPVAKWPTNINSFW